ncbi:MAG: PorP/SprF family type IX secretion system membrane protein [Bacteroidales bacterium]|jgi:type IX secretion system PorP/SprF family membrane protein|nr:PorP/SprF family type IX secretion system membrane protein [Bacteroidales bacterium]
MKVMRCSRLFNKKCFAVVTFVYSLKLFLIFCIYTFNVQAQDVRFSSLEANPLFLNPALTGFFAEQFRCGTVYRNQWSSVSKGYNTFLLTAESHLYQSKNGTGLSFGLEFISDVAGSLSYGSRNVGLSVAFYKSFGQQNKHVFSFAVKGNRQSYSYDVTNADFGASPSDLENIPLNSFYFYDVSAGFHWQTAFDNGQIISSGLSLSHINKPAFSYFATNNSNIPLKTNFYATYFFESSSTYAFKPIIIAEFQNTNLEVVAGSEIILDLNPMLYEEKSFAAGLYYRVLDALILTGVFTYNNLNIGISYDINLSMLTPVSKSYGAVEIWLNYAFNINKRARRLSKIPCPVF